MKFLRLQAKEENITLIGLIKDDCTNDEFLEKIEDMTGIEFSVIDEEEVDNDTTASELEEKYGISCVVSTF